MVSNAEPAKSNVPGIVAMAWGAVLVVATFLTWASATVTLPSAGLDKTFTTNGMDAGDDGRYMLAAGIVALIIGAMFLANVAKPRVQGIIVMIAGSSAIVTGLIDYSDATSPADVPANLTAAGGKVTASAGIGLYLVIAAGVGLIVGAILLMRSGRATAGEVPTGPADGATASPTATPSA